MKISKKEALKILLEEDPTVEELNQKLQEIEVMVDLLLRAMGFDPNNLPDPKYPEMPHFVLKRIYGIKPKNQSKKGIK